MWTPCNYSRIMGAILVAVQAYLVSEDYFLDHDHTYTTKLICLLNDIHPACIQGLKLS